MHNMCTVHCTWNDTLRVLFFVGANILNFCRLAQNFVCTKKTTTSHARACICSSLTVQEYHYSDKWELQNLTSTLEIPKSQKKVHVPAKNSHLKVHVLRTLQSNTCTRTGTCILMWTSSFSCHQYSCLSIFQLPHSPLLPLPPSLILSCWVIHSHHQLLQKREHE